MSLALSFDTLKTDARQVLHALSLHPAGTTTDFLREILPDDVALVPSIAELVRKSLVEKTGSQLRVLAPIREFVRARTSAESAEPLLRAAIEAHTHELHQRLSNAYRLDSGAEWGHLAHNLANVGALVDDGLRSPNTIEPAIELVAAACLVFRGTGRIDEGLEYLGKALAAVRNGSVLEGNLIEERGHLLRAGARLPSALSAYEDALRIWSGEPQTAPPPRDREAVCHLRIGDVLRLLGRYDDATEHYLLGLRLHEELGENPLARGDAIECLADVARVTGDWHRAITHYTEAHQAFESVPDGWVGMTNTAHSLGETRLALRDVDGTRIDYDKALLISQRIGDPQGQANALLGLAKTNLLCEDFDAVAEQISAAAEIYDQIGDGLAPPICA